MQKAVSFTGVHYTRSILLAGLFVMIGISSLGFVHSQYGGTTGIPVDGCYDITCDVEPEYVPLPRVILETTDSTNGVLVALVIAAAFGGVAVTLFIRDKSGRYTPSFLLLFGIAVIMIAICFILFNQTCVTTNEVSDPSECTYVESYPHDDLLVISCPYSNVERCISTWDGLSQFLAAPFK